MIHRSFCTMENTASSSATSYLYWTSGLVVHLEEDQSQEMLCGLPDIGGHIMKIPIIAFQVLLCMCFEGTPAGAKDIPLPVLFSPFFLLQGIGVYLLCQE